MKPWIAHRWPKPKRTSAIMRNEMVMVVHLPKEVAGWIVEQHNESISILAAEVERLRADLERAEQKIEADRIARDHIIAKGVAVEKELSALKTDIRMAQEGTK